MTFALHNVTSTNPAGVYAYDLNNTAWSSVANRPDVHQKAVHTDPEKGLFVGAVAFDACTSTGLHQHTGVASAYLLEGAIADYGDIQVGGDFAINHAGATHDAYALAKTIFVSKLEAPLVFPAGITVMNLDNNPLRGEIANPDPEVLPDKIVRPHEQVVSPTAIAGVARSILHDYANDETTARIAKLRLLPGTRLPVYRQSGWAHWYVLGGEVIANGVSCKAGGFLVLEPGTELRIRSDFGCLAIAWAEGRSDWVEDSALPDLYGF